MEGDQPALDLSTVPRKNACDRATLDAMNRNEPLLYHGRLEVGNC